MIQKFNKKSFLLKKKKLKFVNKILIKFNFISLISPYLIKNLRFNFNSFLKEKKILLKQSYILLTWFYYISFLENKNKDKDKNKIKIFVFPLKNEKFTLTKAPMAHKNWSKEQYKFSFYKFIIKFNSFLKEENKIKSLNEVILFILLTKKNFPFFETNIFFLKNISFFLNFKENTYFNYYNFLNFKGLN